ncbi:MAG: aldehyde ferredoxin oxidoreductase [Syntrophaceae bacterium]|nr:aldehyde ferredoxin oxidoreductase [Syntrophaceae bacterium]
MIVRVNVSKGDIVKEAVPGKYALMAGRQLTSQVILDEIAPKSEPLGEDNKLVIAPGLLAGTSAPNVGRLSVGAKSPLTGGIKESNAGGNVARKLANLGIKAIIVEGKPPVHSWYILKMTKDDVALIPGSDLLGVNNFELMNHLRQSYGPKVGILSIGQAGEMRLNAASIAVSDLEGLPNRHCGRGGLGAVMGAKGIKAVVIDDRGAHDQLLDIVDRNGFTETARAWAKSLAETRKGLTQFGTSFLVDVIDNVGGLPTRNFSSGHFEGAEKINAHSLTEFIKERNASAGHPCSPGCVIRCCNKYNDSEGSYVVSSLEYETIALMGANLGIASLDTIAAMNRRCNDYGLDTMEIGVAIGVAMEAGIAKFGDETAAQRLIDEIARGTVLGRVIGQGAAITGRVFAVRRVPAVKGQAIPGYDPRALKGTAVTYCTSPMGPDHTAGNCLPGRGGVDPSRLDGQIKVSRDLQVMSIVLDVMGLCLFVGPMTDSMEVISQLLTHATGENVSVQDVLEIGKSALRTELRFNKLAGLTREDDRLPKFFRVEKLPPNDLLFDIADDDLDETLSF